MKVSLLIICFLFSAFPIFGQPMTMNHLFKDKGTDISPFFSPGCQLTEIAGAVTIMPGIKAGLILNKRIAFGVLYNFTIKDLTIPQTMGGSKMGMKYGGFLFEYTLWPLQQIHLTIPFSTGIGKLNITDTTTVNARIPKNTPSFVYAEPGLAIEVNIWRYTKFEIGGVYRYTTNATDLINANHLSGFSFIASVKFGFFNYEETKRERDRIKALRELKNKSRMDSRNEKIIESRNEKINKKVNGKNRKKVKK